MQQGIISYLKKRSGDYVSGEELSRHYAMSRTAIWKHIRELRGLGYGIEAAPHLGYKLKSVPDKLFPQEISAGLSTDVIGQTIYHYEELSSTMDEAFRLGTEGAVEGTVVTAEKQTAGRGRMGRSWVSVDGKGVALSLILRPELPPTQIAKLTFMTAVCVCEALQSAGINFARIKWPNDILIDDGKIAGILTELHAETDRVRFVVVGIGINVNEGPKQLPKGAASCRSILGRPVSRVEITRALLLSIERHYRTVRADGFEPVVARWRNLCQTLGEEITFEDARGRVRGRAVDIDPYGGLIIELDNGQRIHRMSGDVTGSRNV